MIEGVMSYPEMVNWQRIRAYVEVNRQTDNTLLTFEPRRKPSMTETTRAKRNSTAFKFMREARARYPQRRQNRPHDD